MSTNLQIIIYWKLLFQPISGANLGWRITKVYKSFYYQHTNRDWEEFTSQGCLNSLGFLKMPGRKLSWSLTFVCSITRTGLFSSPTLRFASLNKLSLSWLLITFPTFISSINTISAASSKAYLLSAAVCSKLRA